MEKPHWPAVKVEVTAERVGLKILTSERPLGVVFFPSSLKNHSAFIGGKADIRI